LFLLAVELTPDRPPVTGGSADVLVAVPGAIPFSPSPDGGATALTG